MLQLPHAFEHYEEMTIGPELEMVSGGQCVVLEAKWERTLFGKSVTIQERIMFDPHIGYAPRRWEQSWNGKLQGVRVNQDFREYGKGYWLPGKCTWTRFPPEWVKEAYRNRPAYSYRMQLLRVRCGDAARDVILQKALTAAGNP